MTHTIPRFLRYELARFHGRAKLALAFITLIPLLYGGIYLHANWDLYTHIGDIKVAVVNQDRPVSFQGKSIHGGQDFVSTLKSQPVFDWQFLDDEDAAEEGLREGHYYMVVKVPADFSANLVSASNLKPARAVLSLHRDDGNGFIIGSLTGKAEDALGKALDSAVATTYFQALFGSLEKIRTGMATAADGAAQLDTNLAKAADGVHQVNQGVTGAVGQNTAMNAAITQTSNGIAATSKGIDEVTAGIDAIQQGADAVVASGASAVTTITQLNAGVSPLISYVDATAPGVVKSSTDLGTTSGTLAGTTATTMGTNLADTSAALDALVAGHPELGADPALTRLRQRLATAAQTATTVKTQAADLVNLSSAVRNALAPAQLTQINTTAKNALKNAEANAQQTGNGVDQVRNGIRQTRAGAADVRAGLTQVSTAGRQMLSAGSSALGGLVTLSNALGQLDTAMPQLSAGAHKLAGGLQDGVKQIPQLNEDERNTLSSVMATPVDVQQRVDHDARYYGRGLAPFFFSIALWIAGVSSYLVLRTTSGRALSSRAGSWRVALAGFAPLATVGVVGALLMGLGVWVLLGLDPVHPGLFLFLLVLSALTFLSLAHWLRLWLGSPQTALFLILLIMQLPASGGTFPVSMLNSFYQGFATVAPMRYTVDAFRVVISGGQMDIFWRSVALLTLSLVISLILIRHLVERRQRFRMRDLHPPMITSTFTGDHAFSVRAR